VSFLVFVVDALAYKVHTMYCGSGAAGGVGPVAPGAAFAATGTLVGKDANYDGQITPNEMGFVPDGGAAYPDGDCHDCVKTVTTYKTVQVPCTRNQYRTVNIKIPKTVPYTAFRQVTKFREITKQVPRTIFVNVPEKIPYTVQEPYTAHKTIFIDQPKTTCTPVTKMITRRIPVVNVVPQNPGPCPPDNYPVNPIYPINPIQPICPDRPIHGGWQEVPLTAEIEGYVAEVKEVALHRLRKEGHDVSKWERWDIISVQKQIVAGTNYKVKVHVHHKVWIDLMIFVPLPHTHKKVELTNVTISRKHEWAL